MELIMILSNRFAPSQDPIDNYAELSFNWVQLARFLLLFELFPVVRNYNPKMLVEP